MGAATNDLSHKVQVDLTSSQKIRQQPKQQSIQQVSVQHHDNDIVGQNQQILVKVPSDVNIAINEQPINLQEDKSIIIPQNNQSLNVLPLLDKKHIEHHLSLSKNIASLQPQKFQSSVQLTGRQKDNIILQKSIQNKENNMFTIKQQLQNFSNKNNYKKPITTGHLSSRPQQLINISFSQKQESGRKIFQKIDQNVLTVKLPKSTDIIRFSIEGEDEVMI